MKKARQARQEARALWRLCLSDGVLDEARTHVVVDGLAESGRADDLAVLRQFVKNLRVYETNRTATIASAAPLDPGLRSTIERDLTRMRGYPVQATFLVDPTLIGGVRVQVGTDVYDGTIRKGLVALQARF
jgi:F-type H+-transporting ATPase subunit delta